MIAQANIALAIIFRQQYVINFLGWLATRPPVTWPVRVRWALAKFYHFGGLHVGFALAGTVWYLAFVAMLIYGFATGKGGVGVADVAVSSVVASLIVVIVFMARPGSRAKRHDTFEATHRFLGWAVAGARVGKHDRVRGQPRARLSRLGAAHRADVLAAGGDHLRRRMAVAAAPQGPGDGRAALLAPRDPAPEPGPEAARRHDPRDQPQPAVRMAPVRERPGRGRVRRPRVPDDRLPSRRLDRRVDRQSTRARLGPRHPDGRTSSIVKKLFSKVVIVATGSGIGPALGHLLAAETPSQLVWATRDPTETYGAALVEEILTAQPDAIIWDTDELGRPDMLRLAYRAYITSGAEAVICISNKTLTWQVVHGLEQRGIPAFGPVWDS